MEEVVLDCLKSADVDAALEAACARHRQHASTIRRVAARLRTLGIDAPTGRGPDLARLGPFELRERLGEGGMGVVYRAWQDPPGREVALKVIRPELLHFDGSRARFRREIEASVKLSHPGIVPVHEVGVDEGVPWFSMAYVRGRSLAAALEHVRGRDRASLRASDLYSMVDDDVGTDGSWIDAVLAAVHGVAIALRHAHSRGVLHRDVKPSNIMLAADGRAMLLDFGLAHTDDGQDLTRSHSMLGSLPYMAPEQIRGDGREPGVEVDVYGLGVTLYEALTLENPFLGANAEETRRRVLAAAPKPPRELDPRIPRDLEVVCSTAMAEHPSQRYTRVADFVRDLDAVRAGEPILASPDSWLDRATRFVRRNRTFVAATCIVIATLAVAVGISLSLYFESEAQRGLAEASRDRAEWTAYVASLASAEDAIRAHRVANAIERLREVPQHLAGWEWRHLVSRLDLSRTTHLQVDGALSCVAAAGHRIACGGAGGLWVLDLGAGAILRHVETRPVSDLAVSPNGNLVAWVDGHHVCVLDVASGDVQRFAAHEWTCIDVDASGEHVVAGSRFGYVFVFRLADHSELHRMRVEDWVSSVAFSPDGQRVACGGYTRSVHILDLDDPGGARRLRGHRGIVEDVAFDCSGTRIASASRDGSVRLWDVESGKSIGFPFLHDAGVRSVAFRPNDRELVAAAGDSLFRWHASRGLLLGASHGHVGAIGGVSWLDGSDIVTVSRDGTLRQWHADSEDLPSLRAHGHAVSDIALSPGGDVVASVSHGDSLLRVWRVADRQLLFDAVSFGLEEPCAVCFDASGERTAFVGSARALVFETNSWSKISEIRSRAGGLRTAVFTPDGRGFIAGGAEGEPLAAWNLETGERFAEQDVEGTVEGLAIDTLGARILVAGSHGLRTHALETLEPLHELTAIATFAVAVRGDGALFASAHDDGCRTWQADGLALQHVLPGRGNRAVLFEPRGTRLFSVGDDGAIEVWAGAALAARLRAGNSPVRCLDFDRDGALLASGDGLGDLRMWPADEDAELDPK